VVPHTRRVQVSFYIYLHSTCFVFAPLTFFIVL
jgi:hypothetical protein